MADQDRSPSNAAWMGWALMILGIVAVLWLVAGMG